MLAELARIELGRLGKQPRLLLDYVAGRSEGISPFLPSLRTELSARFEGSGMSWRRLEGDAVARWAEVVDAITETSARLGADRALLDGLDQAKSRRARFVVTGQQPGALGGPLYVLYKLATAIAVAATLEENLGDPCIPLYWCGSDDSDFREVRGHHVTTRELSVVTASLAHEAHAAGMPVGDIDKKWDADVWKSVRPFIEAHPAGPTVAGLVDEAFVEATDHGELACAVLLRLLRGRFAVVDGRSPEVRRYARSVFAEYVENEGAIKDQVAEAGSSLEAAGYHAQLRVGPDSGVFLVGSGQRRSVPSNQRDLLLEAVRSRVEACSPGVVLRNLVQDYTFEPLAVVLGPAEIAYRAQIRGVYERFGLAAPVGLPRMAATFAPPPLAELVTSEEVARLMVEEPAKFASDVYRSQTAGHLAEAVSAFDRNVRSSMDRLSSQIASEVSGKALAKLRGRMKEVATRVDQLSGAVMDIGRIRALERWPFLSELSLLMRPGDKPQERRLSSMTPYLHSPGDITDGLIDLASAHVAELMDGRSHHVVYSHRP
jgi:uncharacterized protein YllA (UPF0747 family)